ncbi:hypothetical protein ACFRAR_16180 [Kitasatospora sp. NPDC056651]|uniref:hypothetical protein n=1 Tax=Kitasatospora sp. NPDC056651 TaxID=3345892 RepID=UPI003689DEE6
MYREVVTGPAKFELARLSAGWSPLKDYRAADAAASAPSVDRPDGYREGTCWVCRRETLVCAGTVLHAPGDEQSTCHLICHDCITRARTPQRRAALRAALAPART